jgi:DNA-directed RNA polymerase subunit RPC12/RpoP
MTVFVVRGGRVLGGGNDPQSTGAILRGKAMSSLEGKMSFAELPEIQCPKCAHRWEPDGGHDIEEGDRIRCPRCRTQIECDEVEEIRSAYWSVLDDEDDSTEPSSTGDK